jgi:cytochrome c5
MRRKLPGAKGGSIVKTVLSCAFAMLSGPALAQGNIEAGKLKADTCMGCHGVPSYSNVYPTYHVPKLGGQHAAYIVAALQAYKTGQRDHDTMHAQAATLSTQDMEDIAAWFESLGTDAAQAAPAPASSGAQQQKTKPTSAPAANDKGKKASGDTQVAGGASQAQGQKIYAQACAACHDSGAAGAPKLTDKAAWQSRIKQGKPTLYKHAINGFGAMPPKGGQPNLSDAEVEAAVDYMFAEVTGGGAQTKQQSGKAAKGQ